MRIYYGQLLILGTTIHTSGRSDAFVIQSPTTLTFEKYNRQLTTTAINSYLDDLNNIQPQTKTVGTSEPTSETPYFFKKVSGKAGDIQLAAPPRPATDETSSLSLSRPTTPKDDVILSPDPQSPPPFKQPTKSIPETIIQGSSLKTYNLSPAVRRIHLTLATKGRPLDAEIETWAGPGNVPQKINVQIEDGSQRPFDAVIEFPHYNNAVVIRNTGPMSFPMTAMIDCDADGSMEGAATMMQEYGNAGVIVQGGSLKTFPVDGGVSRARIVLRTDGRPLYATIEILQGPNNKKQVMDVYTENGDERPFYAVVEMPGQGSIVRVVNTASMEYPLYAMVDAVGLKRDEEDDFYGDDLLVVMGGR